LRGIDSVALSVGSLRGIGSVALSVGGLRGIGSVALSVGGLNLKGFLSAVDGLPGRLFPNISYYRKQITLRAHLELTDLFFSGFSVYCI